MSTDRSIDTDNQWISDRWCLHTPVQPSESVLRQLRLGVNMVMDHGLPLPWSHGRSWIAVAVGPKIKGLSTKILKENKSE